MTTTTATVAARLGDQLDHALDRTDSVAAETVAPSAIIAPEVLGEPVVGLTTRTDADARQEFGLDALRTALTGTDHRNFTMVDDARRFASLCVDANAFALSSEPLPATFAWGDPLRGARDTYAQRWQDRLAHVRGAITGDRWMTYQQLRALATSLGVTAPLPRSKQGILDAINALDDAPCTRPDHWPADFSYGATFIVRADHGAAATIVAALRDAIDTGSLAIGSASGPFHQGILLYDARDETPELVAARDAQLDFYDDAMAALAPVQAALEAAGHGFYFLGNPRAGGWTTADGTEDTAVRYWLNGKPRRGHDEAQPFGWYTLEQLAAEAFLRPRTRS